ncbi:hypothetical protein ACET3Z_020790 [Daucus carota]
MKLSKRLRVLRPCKYLVLRIFKLRFRKRLLGKFQRKQQLPQHQNPDNDRDSRELNTRKTVSFRSVLRFLRFTRKTKTSDNLQMDRMMKIKSFSSAAVENQDKLCVGTATTTSTNNVTAGSGDEDKYSCVRTTDRTVVGKWECSEEVEEACRSFENYLAEMIVEQGRTKDLMDVEQLLYCWDNLRCPVFIDLVSRFYGELCKDLFTSN